MQKWEYLYVIVDVGKNGWRPYWENGRELPDWQNGPLIYEYMNKKGEEGWELVATPLGLTSNEAGSLRELHYTLMFKRPRP